MTVHFIGAGPGAADLLTVRAVRLLQSSPVCVYAGTYVDPEVLAHCPPQVTLVDSARLDLDQIVEHLRAAHEACRDVARLCSGDPSLYSALAEQTRRLDRLGIPWDVTPGVPAYAAAAAIVGRESRTRGRPPRRAGSPGSPARSSARRRRRGRCSAWGTSWWSSSRSCSCAGPVTRTTRLRSGDAPRYHPA